MITRTKIELTGDRNQCPNPTCGLLFNSVSAFDKHRVGFYGINRRCLAPAEMREIGMTQNVYGFWVTRPRDAATLPRAGGIDP